MKLTWVLNKYFGYDGLDSNGITMATIEPVSSGYGRSGYWGVSIRMKLPNTLETRVDAKPIGEYFELKTAKLMAELELNEEFSNE